METATVQWNKQYKAHEEGVMTAVERMEERYPQMTSEFKRIQAEQYNLFCAKMLNYGTSNIALGTALDNPDDVKISLSGIWFRMMDKISRLKQLVLLGQPDNVKESVEDTFGDLSVYGILAQIITSGKWAK
jgi:hypothetical protein